MFKNLVSKKNFSIDRLATLCHIAEAGSIGTATGDDANRQSQYSRQIAELESFLGIDLLDRHAKPFRVSEQGQELAHISRNFLGVLDDFIGTCKNQPSKLVIGSGESQIQWLLIPGILPRLRKAMPRTLISFRNLRTRSTIDSLIDGEIDLGFVRKNAVPKNLKSIGSWSLGYRLFVPKKFRAGLKAPVSLSQLTDLPMAVLGSAGQFRTMLEEQMREMSIELKFAFECSSSTQVAQLVSRKECCAILPSIARAQLDKSSIEDFPVKEFKSQERRLCFAWNPRRAEIRPIIEKAVKLCSSS